MDLPPPIAMPTFGISRSESFGENGKKLGINFIIFYLDFPNFQTPTKKPQTTQPSDPSSTIIELLTKSYEAFKLHTSPNISLYLASEIARINTLIHRPEHALKLFLRISKTYRKQGWTTILVAHLRQLIALSWQTRDLETLVRASIELLDFDADLTNLNRVSGTDWKYAERSGVVYDAYKFSGGVNVDVDMDGIYGFIKCSIEFDVPETNIGVFTGFGVLVYGKDLVRIRRVYVNFTEGEFDECFEGVKIGEEVRGGIVGWREMEVGVVGVWVLVEFEGLGVWLRFNGDGKNVFLE